MRPRWGRQGNREPGRLTLESGDFSNATIACRAPGVSAMAPPGVSAAVALENLERCCTRRPCDTSKESI